MLLSRRFAFGSRLSFFLCQEKRDGLRCVAFSWCWRGCRAWRERGAGLRGDAFSITALGLRSMPELAVLLGRFALGAGLALRLYRGVLPSFTPVFFPLSGKKRRLAMRCVSIPLGRDRHSCALAALVRLSGTSGSLRACAFLYGDLDGLPGDAEDGVRGWRRGLCALLRNHIGFVMLSAGSTLGLRAPDCAKESNVEAALRPLWTLFTLRLGCVGANTHPCKKRQRPNRRTHACKTRVHGKTRPALIYGRAGRAV